MKKVIFVGLLCLAASISQPVDDNKVSNSTSTGAIQSKGEKTEQSVAPEHTTNITNATPGAGTVTKNSETSLNASPEAKGKESENPPKDVNSNATKPSDQTNNSSVTSHNGTAEAKDKAPENTTSAKDAKPSNQANNGDKILNDVPSKASESGAENKNTVNKGSKKDKDGEKASDIKESATGAVNGEDKEKTNGGKGGEKKENVENPTTINTSSMEKSNSTKPTVPPKAEDKKDAVVQARSFDGPSFIGGIILTLGILAIGFMGFKYYKTQTERNYHTL